MKTGKLPTSNTKPPTVSDNSKNYQRLLVILGSGLLMIVLAYRLFTGLSVPKLEQLDPIPATLTVQVVAQIVPVPVPVPENRKEAAIQLAELEPVPATQRPVQVVQVDSTLAPLEPIQLILVETGKTHDVDGRLTESMNSPEQQRAEKTRLESIKQAKAQLKGDDETLWQAAVTRLESLEPLDGEAMFLLGASYTFPNGISGISGIKHDEKLACQWFKKAADADNKRGKHYAELPPCTNYKS